MDDRHHELQRFEDGCNEDEDVEVFDDSAIELLREEEEDGEGVRRGASKSDNRLEVKMDDGVTSVCKSPELSKCCL